MSKLRNFSSGLQSAAKMKVRQNAVRFFTNTNCLNHDTSAQTTFKICDNLSNLCHLCAKILICTILTIIVTSAYGQELVVCQCDNGYFGYKDRNTNNMIIPCKYQDASKFSEGLAAVKQDGKWGYIDHKGIVVIPFKYKKALPFSEDLAVVKIDGVWYFIYKTGKLVLPVYYLTKNEALRDSKNVKIKKKGE